MQVEECEICDDSFIGCGICPDCKSAIIKNKALEKSIEKETIRDIVLQKRKIINNVEDFIKSTEWTLEDIISEINDTLGYLTP